jgi:hypothetical protein
MILLVLKTKNHQKIKNKKISPYGLIFNYKLIFANKPEILKKINREDSIIIKINNLIFLFLIAIKIKDKRKNTKKELNKNHMLLS